MACEGMTSLQLLGIQLACQIVPEPQDVQDEILTDSGHKITTTVILEGRMSFWIGRGDLFGPPRLRWVSAVELGEQLRKLPTSGMVVESPDEVVARDRMLEVHERRLIRKVPTCLQRVPFRSRARR